MLERIEVRVEKNDNGLGFVESPHLENLPPRTYPREESSTFHDAQHSP